MLSKLTTAAIIFDSLLRINSQLASTVTPEKSPALDMKICTAKGCSKSPASITIDANWRSLKDVSGQKDCFSNNAWDQNLCQDPVSCAKNCALGGYEYGESNGIVVKGDSITLKLFNANNGVGSRVYLLDGKDKYKMFQLLNKEITFEVDVSKAPCGVNGALYLTAMKADGGKSESNQAGAALGTGYCDAQSPTDSKFIEGKANIKKSGIGCPEMDILEANSLSQAYTVHPCKNSEPTVCEGDACKANGGLCDTTGCDFASYRLGNPDFYGPAKGVDTKQKITVTTQFITSDGTDNGELVEIKRVYAQKGKSIQNSVVRLPNIKAYNSISEQFCADMDRGGPGTFAKNNGLKSVSQALKKGMVLVMAIWDDPDKHMTWLDGTPTGANSQTPGTVRGPCPAGAGDPANIKNKFHDASVEFSNIRSGPIGSTTK